ncbi:MAG TPA: C40 family peptidase [Ferruginibacter sp.]|nr:C40 family peptidase [Ferruginibacter sp.]
MILIPKQYRFTFFFFIIYPLLFSCNSNGMKDNAVMTDDSVTAVIKAAPSLVMPETKLKEVKNGDPNTIVDFAETLMGIPYRYGSTDPSKGFDCSGFITYVFNHFGIKVPRSSIDFTNEGKEILVTEAKRGDLILFTGTDSTEKFVGHMGIVTQNTDTLKFIHSTSGKQYGVTITPLNNYYKGRFVKVIRIF